MSIPEGESTYKKNVIARRQYWMMDCGNYQRMMKNKNKSKIF
jgi:hypothetical protein